MGGGGGRAYDTQKISQGKLLPLNLDVNLDVRMAWGATVYYMLYTELHSY